MTRLILVANRHRRPLIAATVGLLYLLVIWWLYRNMWSFGGVRHGLGWDVIESYGPDQEFASSEISRGQWSLWNPYDRGGYPLIADPEYQRWYPLAWPFACWGALFGQSLWIIQIKMLAHQWIAAMTMHSFLRSRGLRHQAAFVGGVVLVTCMPMLTHKASLIIAPIVWVPLVWQNIDSALRRATWQSGVALGFCLALVVMAGSPPGWWYAAIAVAGYGIARVTACLCEVALRRQRLQTLAVGLMVFVGLALVVLLPAMDLVALGVRSEQHGVSFALDGAHTLQTVFTGAMLFRSPGAEFYFGSVVLLLTCSGLVVASPTRRLAILLTVLALIALLLSTGANGWLLGWLVRHIPMFDHFRVPGRYKLIAAFAIAATAAIGCNSVLDRARTLRQAKILAALTTGFCVATWLMDGKNTVVFPIVVGVMVVAILMRLDQRIPDRVAQYRATLFAAVCCVALLWDAAVVSDGQMKPGVTEPMLDHQQDPAIIRQLAGTSEEFRIYDEFVLGQRPGMRHRLRDFRGYPAVYSLSDQRQVAVINFAKKDPGILADFNVRYVLHGNHFRSGDRANFVGNNIDGHKAFTRIAPQIWQAVNPAPLAALYSSVLVANESEMLATIRGQSDAISPSVVVSAEQSSLQSHFQKAALPRTAATLQRYQPDEITLNVPGWSDANPRVLVLNEAWFPGWAVYLDGAPQDGFRCQWNMRCVVINASNQNRIVDWKFEPRLYPWLRNLHIAVYLLCFVAFATGWRAKRRD
jgi:hypothetical protein